MRGVFLSATLQAYTLFAPPELSMPLSNGRVLLILEPKGEDIVVRKGRLVDSREDFEELADRVAERFKEKRISYADIEDAVRWARGNS